MVRTRVRWAGVLASILGGALAANLMASGAGARPADRGEHRIYVVRPGDTVWSIVGREAGRGADPRPLVDQLIRLNRLRDAVIHPGQRLVLPT
ncbi:MAG: LysM peptidoglycan-binding domain-containing protein [Actinomycetota bacterium]